MRRRSWIISLTLLCTPAAYADTTTATTAEDAARDGEEHASPGEPRDAVAPPIAPAGAVRDTRGAPPHAPDAPPRAPKGSARDAEVFEAQPTDAPRSDHVDAVGRLAVGFVGVRDLALGTIDNTFAAPTIALRRWFTERWALEVGVGIGHSSGTITLQQAASTSSTLDAATQWGLALQVGAPCALAWGEHYALVLTPEARLGLTWLTPSADPSLVNADSAYGTTLELGGRAGAELHFGFIGIPELTLEASLGVSLRYVRVGSRTGSAVRDVTQVSVSTASYNDPWDFFRSSVAARYYF